MTLSLQKGRSSKEQASEVSISNPEKTQSEALTKSPFEGIRLCCGQLAYYRRKHPTKRTLEPNMAPGLFMGWRVDSGLRHKCVVRVMDYQEFRTKSNAMVLDVPPNLSHC